VGALLNRQFRFKSRVWWLKQADNVCSSCARGCNIRVDHHWNKVQRLVPRPNPDVNKFWMCDRGRMNFQSYNDNRLVEARVAGRDSTLRDAIDTLAARLGAAAGDVAVLLSPKLANEELLVLRRLFGDLVRAKTLGAGSLEPDQPQDDILRRADPHPNSFAVGALALQGDVRKIVSESRARVLVVVGDDPLGWDPALAGALGTYETVAAIVTNSNATAQAVDAAGGILLPLATHMEFAGSFTNFEGRVQAFEPALASPGSAMSAYDLGIELAHTLGVAFWPRPEHSKLLVEAIWEELLPAGAGVVAPAWSKVPASELAGKPRPTAQPTTKGYTPSGTV
jgi:NADH-quinone oxidoreductase subunit G